MTKTILRLDASMRKTGSYGRVLSDKLIKKLHYCPVKHNSAQISVGRVSAEA
jgi:hypothetical protein